MTVTAVGSTEIDMHEIITVIRGDNDAAKTFINGLNEFVNNYIATFKDENIELIMNICPSLDPE